MKFTLFSEESINKLLQQYLDRGLWSRAADQYKKLIKLHPENINLRLRMAEACVKSRNKKGALEQYQLVAEHYMGLEDPSKAVTILRTMLNIDSGLSHIRIKLAELYGALGDMEEMWNQYLTAFKYLEEKKLVAQSVSVLEQMAKLKFEETKPMIQLAEMFLARNLQPQAISQFLSIAEFFLQRGQFEEATKYYNQVVSIDSENREARKGLAVLRHLTQPTTPETEQTAAGEAGEERVEAVSTALVIPSVEEELAALLAQQVNQRITSEEDFHDHYNLGIVYQDMALLDAAIEEFVQAAADPNLQLKCYQSLSKCFEQKGMSRQAQKYQQKYLSLSLS